MSLFMAGGNFYDTQRYSLIYTHLQSIPKKLPSNGEEEYRMPWDKGSVAFATSAYPQAKTERGTLQSDTETLTKLLHCSTDLYC